MKIRQGFVSNSSSSSFIIKKDGKYKNVFDLAKDMLQIVDYKPQLKRLEKSNRNPDTSVRFYSCNYDTYIKSYGDYMLVNTCNNEDWDSLYDLNVILPEFDDGYGDSYIDMKDDIFWCLENDVDFKDSKTYCTCKNCNYEFVNIQGEDQCPRCFTDANGNRTKYGVFIDREKKLKRIV
jgi:hypothetical protein